MRKIYGYVRVSSRDQNSLRQIDAMRAAGVAEENIYTDYASGKDFERTEYKHLKSALSNGDIVIIKSIDRLGRNYNEIIAEWRSITKELMAHIRVLDLPLLDTTAKARDLTGTLISDIVLQILSYVAEQERINIRQRQAEGIALARSLGKHLGRPPLAIPENFWDVYSRYKNGGISLRDALEALSMKRSSFYNAARRKKTPPEQDAGGH
jgi:DNA invertase Pin-like site-specific DNA recombinase